MAAKPGSGSSAGSGVVPGAIDGVRLLCLLCLLLCTMPAAQAQDRTIRGSTGSDIAVEVLAEFDEPWAMTFLPDGRLLVTEKPGRMVVWDPVSGQQRPVRGLPDIRAERQGGLGDVILHPGFAANGIIYFSYVERQGRMNGAVVAAARLEFPQNNPRLTAQQIIWRQAKVTGAFHYAYRLALDSDGMLYITSGDRFLFDPSQDLRSNLGKVIRLNPDGSIPADNPFADRGGIAAQVWSYGHRNPLGIAFAPSGDLWVHEMGPRGGDEFNLIERGANYGWPTVSQGDHYDGRRIPGHDTRPDLNAPEVAWVPSISPSGLVVYDGAVFADWRGDALMGGLSSMALIRVEIDGNQAREAERFDMGQRIREVEQGPDGALYLLEDGPGARLLRLTPA